MPVHYKTPIEYDFFVFFLIIHKVTVDIFHFSDKNILQYCYDTVTWTDIA